MDHRDAGEGDELDREVAVADRVQAVFAQPVEAELARHGFPVQWVAGAGQRGRAQRQAVAAFADIGQALGVAREHLHIGQQVVRKAHRLRHLKMGETWHHGVGVDCRDFDQRALQLDQQQRQRVDLAAQPQPHIGGDLVVARAAGV